ncbi:hypothetical protein NDU88_004650 [Pleurodeles waltl]|uniref:Uncharacterized protein n=1 Tax=Pleurodeles waltl TaxID=8319 RepID=A0AAV7VLD1_PLEWA|nr:hypothetical protein NDU88_004650 [Pleurodeles waltl]
MGPSCPCMSNQPFFARQRSRQGQLAPFYSSASWGGTAPQSTRLGLIPPGGVPPPHAWAKIQPVPRVQGTGPRPSGYLLPSTVQQREAQGLSQPNVVLWRPAVLPRAPCTCASGWSAAAQLHNRQDLIVPPHLLHCPGVPHLRLRGSGRLFALGATASTRSDPGSGRPKEFKGPDRGRQGSLSQPPPPLNRRAHVEPPYCLSFLAHPARESAPRLGRDRWLRPPPPS